MMRIVFTSILNREGITLAEVRTIVMVLRNKGLSLTRDQYTWKIILIPWVPNRRDTHIEIWLHSLTQSFFE